MRLYRTDFGGREAQLAFAARYVPAIGDSLDRIASGLKIGYARFDWTVAPPR
jgi:hypothetical protein